MKVTLSREELTKIVGEYYNIEDFILEITNEEFKPEVKCNSLTTKVDSNLNVISVESKASKSRPKRQHASIQRQPKVDFSIYAERIEEFINSGEDEMEYPIDDNLSNKGMEYRLRKAIKLYDLDVNISTRIDNKVVLKRKQKKNTLINA